MTMESLCIYVQTPYGPIPLAIWIAYKAATQR
jgi:hypothetical protein